jgi:bifunctional DNA-binding transcriptional regulator/antitoxin component of YhaV-PrlF toxin-antitoxin module
MTPKKLETGAILRDNPSMNATVIDKKRRMTLPESVCEAVGLKPNDQVEWRAEAGEIGPSPKVSSHSFQTG